MTLPDPLHPAVVHMPIALAFLMPLLAGGAALAWWRGWLPGRRLWVAVVVLQALLAGSAYAALRTGEAQEERVEQVVGEVPIHHHEEAAELFHTGSWVVLGLALAALLVPREPLRRLLALVACAGTVVVLGLAYRTGEAGGELVYKHGAAAAYAKGAIAPASDAGAVVEPGATGEHDRD